MVTKLKKEEKASKNIGPVLSLRMTEKATLASDKGTYVFNVLKDATKSEIKKAIIKGYKVTPNKIRIVTIKRKEVIVRGRLGTKKGGKKAYIYLKKGDKIEM